jgi:hypothetical protein
MAQPAGQSAVTADHCAHCKRASSGHHWLICKLGLDCGCNCDATSDSLPFSYITLESPIEVIRIGRDGRGGNEPAIGMDASRFTPVLTSEGEVVPLLYVAEGLWCAMGETVFRDVPDDDTVQGVVNRAELASVRASLLRTTTPIVLADLTDDALQGYDSVRAEVTGTSKKDYNYTRMWAQHVWDTTEFQGMVWNSRRSPGALSYAFFLHGPDAIPRMQSERLKNAMERLTGSRASRRSLEEVLAATPVTMREANSLSRSAAIQARMVNRHTLLGGDPIVLHDKPGFELVLEEAERRNVLVMN